LNKKNLFFWNFEEIKAFDSVVLGFWKELEKYFLTAVGIKERYIIVVESKNLKPENILKVELKKQMETVKPEDFDKEEDSNN
jgi:hypothetical protein